MDYEKKYRDLVEAVKELQEANPSDEGIQKWVEDNVPELAESKDEKIRKVIYGWIYTRPSQFFDDGFSKEEMLAWLEKQGEQILSNSAKTGKDEPKFHEGEWIISNDKKSTYQVIEVKRGIYVIRDNVDNHEYYIGIETCERSGRLWTIEDAKDGDVLYSSYGQLLWIYKDGISCYVGQNLSYSENCVVVNSPICIPSDVCPATKEQRDLLFQKIEEAGYMWDAEKKELKKIEKKLTNSYCQEHCKGFQETGKCFADGDCKAKTTYKDELKEDNRPVTERIKTFDDACQELDTKALSGDETAAFLLADYESNADNINNPQTLAYMRLAIIVYALNEGWVPQFTINEYRFSPWFYLYTKEEYDQMDEEKKGRCVLRSGSNSYAYCGFVNVFANFDASLSSTYYGSRLALRTRELAEYAGKQFIEEWADFVFKSR